MTGARKYSREEADQILTRAAELDSEVPSAEEGLTLDQLFRIAEDAGIEPALVAKAAVQFDEPGAQTFRWLGGPTTIVHNRELRIADPLDFDAMVDELQTEFGDVGRTEIREGRMTWTSTGASGRMIQVQVRQRRDQVSIRLSEPLGGLMGGLYGGIGGGLGGTLGGGLAWVVAMALGTVAAGIWVVGAVLFSLLLARTIFGRIAAVRHASTSRALERMIVAAESARHRLPAALEEDAEAVEPIAHRQHQQGG